MSESAGNLPTQLSDFIGREKESEAVRKLISGHRMVTLTGAGGSGKTRLSINVASELLDKFARGIWFVRFAPLADSKLVPQAVASTLGIRDVKNQPILDGILRHLKDDRSLLIFDNCEHLIDACAQLAEKILHACPKIKILATSREPLGIPGEATWSVPPMSLPERQPWRDPMSGEKALSVYRESDSVQLFLNRAMLVTPEFELTTDNGAWIAEICRRLDGLPLAIELAAARVRALTVEQIVERLDERFNLLTSGNRTAPARHQTLAATIEWSYALLSDEEKSLLRRISVFSGGAVLQAIESICSGEDIEEDKILETLSQLVDKSLVAADRRSRETRYFLLETIRQYARERLIEFGEFDKVRDRHLNYFVKWAEMANSNLESHDQPLWLDRFETEHDNLRAALEWGNSKGDNTDAGLRLAGACGRYWAIRGHLNEGRARISNILARKESQKRTVLRARALVETAHIAYLQSDYPVVNSLAEEALSICRELGEEGRRQLGKALDLLGETATETGDHDSARAYFNEALEIYREVDDVRGLGDMYMQMGWAFMRIGELQEARANLEQAQSIFRKSGNQRYLGFTYSGLGEAALRLGEYKHATTLLDQGLSLARQIRDDWMIATMLGSLGWVALKQNDLVEMRNVLRESLALRTKLGEQGGTAWCLEKLANAANREKEYEKAVMICGAAAALRAPLDSVIDDADLPDYNRLISDLRSALGQNAFDSAWAEGESKPLEEIIALALTDSKTSKQSENVKYSGLTKREREVAKWIAQGKTNREIAEKMSVTPKTVETYVTRILNKLGFDSRVQIATWALEKKLI